MPRVGSKGEQSSQGFGQFALSTAANYIEDVFSTYLYTGNSATTTITNGVDLSTKGGMVWIKFRDSAQDHKLTDTARGIKNALTSNNTAAQVFDNGGLTAFNNNGFTVGSSINYNYNTGTFVSWTFRKQPKFFDVVTYTGNGTTQTIAHNLKSAPGCIIVKRTDAVINWAIYHVSLGRSWWNKFNNEQWFNSLTVWNETDPTTTDFTVGANANTNASGGTYVAYLFAHNSGGFGPSGSDNVISCGSYIGNGSATGPVVTLGFEPQWVMVKSSGLTSNWVIEDVMRGMSQTASNELFPNLTNAETALNPGIIPNATGFSLGTTNADMNNNGSTYIYIAIRRGPMKTPTNGTSVFFPTISSAIGSSDWSTAPLSEKSVDCLIGNTRTSSPNSGFIFTDRLRGLNGSYSTSTSVNLNSTSTAAETTATYPLQLGDSQGTIDTNRTAPNSITYLMKRAPGFFDEVCYTGTSANTTVTHNLGIAPELMIIKSRSSASFNWIVYSAALGATNFLVLNLTISANTLAAVWNNTSPTATVFTVGTANAVNNSGDTYVAYLFASCPGVSKVGSYTGTGATQTISCGFTGGARFVLIKRTDSTGDWYVWDTARGMVSGTDPSLLLNSTAAEVNANSIYTTTGGFQIVSTAAGINASGGTYIFLAIA